MVCSENHIKCMNTLCGQNVELFNDQAAGTNYHCALSISEKIQICNFS
jgi:hypothetical protein